jgi:adenylylsulfate kinase
VVWLTGLSGAGKSTLAGVVGTQLATRRPVEVLDGDEIRLYLSQGLGYSRSDRDLNVHRIAYVARLLAKHGILVFVAAISPYAATRAELARLSREAGHEFVEVYVCAPLETVEARDVKGLYKKARAGDIVSFTGISDPYEPPASPALEVRTDRDSQDACAAAIVAALTTRGLA